MRWTLIIAGTLTVVLWLGPVAWRWVVSTRGRRGGFTEYVRNPLLASKLGGALAKRRSDEDHLVRLPPEQLVEMLLDDQRFDVVRRAIERQGGRSAAALVAAIGDPRYRRKTRPSVYERMNFLTRRHEPLETVLDSLGKHALPEHAATLAPLLADPSKDIRGLAARSYAAIGTDGVIHGALEAMRDPEPSVVRKAIIGVFDATDLGVATPKFREAMYSAVADRVRQGDGEAAYLASRCLLGLDEGRARPWLVEHALVEGEARVAREVLKLFHGRQETIDEAVLCGLWERFAADPQPYPSQYALAAVVTALGRHQSEGAGRIIEMATRSGSELIRVAAAEAMAHRMGITDPYGCASAACEARGWDGMTAPQRHVLAVRNLIDQVFNGGYEQYFVNSYGDDWPDALAGLKAMGAQREHALFANAIARFGPDGPSRDHDQRHEQLAALVRADPEPFDGIADNVFETHDDIEVLLMRYVVANRADFT